MNIVVLAGGLSTEREVSLSSGTKISAALKEAGNNVLLVDAFLGIEELPEDPKEAFMSSAGFEPAKISESEPDLEKVKLSRGESGYGTLGKNVIEICEAADVVYIGLHGENGENGRMQALFDILEIKYTGCGYLASALAMNKALAKTVLTAGGITMPKGLALKKGESTEAVRTLSLPCIAKPCSGGSSIGLTVANTYEELEAAVETAFKYEDEILVEEFIKGREFSVGFLGDRILPPIEIIPKGGIYDYAHKYQAGWTEEICPARITDEECRLMQEAAGKAMDILGLEVYSRMDFILDEKGTPYMLEINSLPGMTPTSLLPQEAQAIGISYEELCTEIVALSLKKYE